MGKREEDFNKAAVWVRDFRAYCIVNKLDPWMIRQALIFALEMDTDAALTIGRVTKEQLDEFDQKAKEEVKPLLGTWRKEGK